MKILKKKDALLYTRLKIDNVTIGQVYIWAPIKKTKKYGPEYWCYYKITGKVGNGKISHAIGFDSMQCVILALKAIGTGIKYSKYVEKNKLAQRKNWDNFDFPIFNI